ncbi:MAG: hypothetical protein JXN59_16235, partial [Anaerolineae bacterium]|nr:hypothetical protein [Anaerolineae bacterium]
LALLLALPVGLIAAQGTDGGLRLGSFDVQYGGRTYDAAADQTTFTYLVAGTGQPPDLSHFDLGIPVCDPALEVVGYSPAAAVSFGTDPTTGIDGIKWDVPLLMTDTRTYSLTISGNIAEGAVSVAVKDGNGFEAGTITGPACTRPAITLKKYVSTDAGQTWLDADIAPGPAAPLEGQVMFRLIVTNAGDTDLDTIQLSDPGYDLSACVIPSALAPEAFFECTLGPFPVAEGAQSNAASVTAAFGSVNVSNTDSAHYYGGEHPAIDVEKYVSVDGGAVWHDADAAPGPQAVTGHDVTFKLVVSNNGTVPLTTITLADPGFDLSACVIPDLLEVGDSFECTAGPTPAVEGQQQNTATVAALAGSTSVSDTDSAFYVGGGEDLPVVIVIEGPVVEIRGNVIVIYGFEVALNPDDPVLVALRIGDYVRVGGGLGDGDADVIVIAASTVVIVNVDIYVNAPSQGTVQVWRDDGECSNLPPPWAPAHGWRAKCEYGVHPGDFNGDRN